VSASIAFLTALSQVLCLGHIWSYTGLLDNSLLTVREKKNTFTWITWTIWFIVWH
jgi:hypothetical protein